MTRFPKTILQLPLLALLCLAAGPAFAHDGPHDRDRHHGPDRRDGHLGDPRHLPVVVDGPAVLRELDAIRDEVRRLQHDAPNGRKGRAARERLDDVADRLERLLRMVKAGRPVHAPHPGPRPLPVGRSPMAPPAFSALNRAVADQAFDSGRISVISTAAQANWFLVSQVRSLVNALSFSQGKLQALRVLWPRVVDRDNAFQIYGAFTFEADKAEARKILER